MKRILLSGFILVDLGLIGGSSYVLFNYFKTHALAKSSGFSTSAPRTPVATSVMTPVSSTAAVSASLVTPVAPSGAADTGTRKILFTYRNSHAKQVAIRADFTGWKAEPMIKGDGGAWTYAVPLTPGEYAYIFAVDDKTLKDPANKRTKQIGRTLVSAILVEPKK